MARNAYQGAGPSHVIPTPPSSLPLPSSTAAGIPDPHRHSRSPPAFPIPAAIPDPHRHPYPTVIPAKAGIQCSQVIRKDQSTGFPLSRE